MLSIIDAFGIKDQKILNDKNQLISFLKLYNNSRSDNINSSNINNQALISTIATLISVIYSIEKHITNDDSLLKNNVKNLNKEHLKHIGFNDDAYDNYEHFADTDDNNNNIISEEEEEEEEEEEDDDDEDASESNDSSSTSSSTSKSGSESGSESESEIEKLNNNADKDKPMNNKNDNFVISGINNKEVRLMNDKDDNANIIDGIVDDNIINIINNNNISSSNNSSSSEGFEYDDVIVNSGDDEEDLNDDLNSVFDSLTKSDSTKHPIPTNFTYNYKPQQKTNLKIPANISANEKTGRTVTIVNWKDTPLSQIALKYNVLKSVIGPTLQVLRDFEKKKAKILQEKIKKNRALNEGRQLQLYNNKETNNTIININTDSNTNNNNNIINNEEKTLKLSRSSTSRSTRDQNLKSRSDAHKVRLRLRNKRKNHDNRNEKISNGSSHLSNNNNVRNGDNYGKFNNNHNHNNNNNSDINDNYDSETSSESVYDPNFKFDDENETEKLTLKDATVKNISDANNEKEQQYTSNENSNGLIKRKSDSVTNNSNNGSVKRVKFSDDIDQNPNNNHSIEKNEILTSEVSSSLYNLLKTSSNEEPYEGFVLSLEDSKKELNKPINNEIHKENEESNKSDDQVPSFAYALTSNGQYQCKTAGCTAKPFSQYIQLYKHKSTQHPQELPS